MLLRKISAIIFLALALVARADTVTGLVQVATADWSSGTKVVFTPTNTLINIGGVAIRSQPATATVNSSGKFSVNLLGPMGYTVAVGDTFVYPRDVMNISVPGDGGTYDWLALTTNTLLVSTQSTAFILRNNGSGTNTTLTAPVLSSASTGTVAGFVWTATWTNGAGAWLAAGSGSVDTVLSNLVNTKQHGHAVLSNAVATGVLTNPAVFQTASTTLSNLAGTGALTNSAQFVASGSGSASNLNVRSLNGVGSLALTVNTNSLVVTNGRVGIGTNAPVAALEVQGGARFSGGVTSAVLAASSTVYAGGINGAFGATFAYGQNAYVPGTVRVDGAARIGALHDSQLAQLLVTNSTAAQVALRVDSSGTNSLARFARGANLVASLSTNGFFLLASNVVSVPTAAQIGLGGTVFWNSNGTHWLARCLDGSTVETKSLW